MNKELHKITYLSILDGKRHSYMNIGFESFEAAESEKIKLIRVYNKRWSNHTDVEIIKMEAAGIVMSTPMIGREYKIEKIKIKTM